MTKKQFRVKSELATKFLNDNFKAEEGVACVILLDAKDEEAKLCYNDIISNIHPSGVIKFIKDIIRIAGSIMGRQN